MNVHTSPSLNRRIRVFVSSTFRDMQVDRDVLVKKVFPQLRKLCESRAVTWTEVDLRWGITEEQANEGQVLPLCLAEIERSRPFFIGILGERYGWVPEGISPDLLEDEPWLKEHHKHSVTELEILHGVLNSPTMADRALFYFRDPVYSDKVDKTNRPDFVCENAESAEKLARLKNRIREAHALGKLKYAPHENYTNPDALAALVLADFTKLINELYPENQVPNPLDQEANRHEEHAHSRRDIYIPRPKLYELLNSHIESDSPPLVLTGESGCGKTALLANWVDIWHTAHPQDLIIQHYIGSTPDSTGWERIVTRILGELKRAFSIIDELPSSPDKLRGAMDEWFVKSAGPRRIVLVLDGLNQLEDRDNAQELGWLPIQFIPNVRVIASVLPGQAFDATQKRGWPTQKVELLDETERLQVVTEYLQQGGRTASKQLLAAIKRQPQTCNPLYLRAFLDEIRQFGRHEELPHEIEKYLSAPTPKELYTKIIERWIHDYPEVQVEESLKLIWAARRGLAESELMDLLGKSGQPLPRRFWTPFYLAAERSLVVRSGLLNFAHDYLRGAILEMLVPNEDEQDEARLRLADYFEKQPVSARSCDELPWLLWKTESFVRLRACLLDIDRFLKIFERDKEEVRLYWVRLGEEREMGKDYLSSFELWLGRLKHEENRISYAANELFYFLHTTSLDTEAEPLIRQALQISEKIFGKDHVNVAVRLGNLATLLQATNRSFEAEPLFRRALEINEKNYGKDHPDVANNLNSIAHLLQHTNRFTEAEHLYRKALEIYESNFGKDSQYVALLLNNLATLLKTTTRFSEAEQLYRQALEIDEKCLGKNRPEVANNLNNLAILLKDTNRPKEAEQLIRRSLDIRENSFGNEHPMVSVSLLALASLLQATNHHKEAEPLLKKAINILEKNYGTSHSTVAAALNSLAVLLQATNRYFEAEPLYRRALEISENIFGKEHPDVARYLCNLGALLGDTNRLLEAEPLMQRALEINEKCLGKEHPTVADALNNLSVLFQRTNRFSEAEPLVRRALGIDQKTFGKNHPAVARDLNNLAQLLQATNRLSEAEPLMKLALEIDEKSFGPNYPNVAMRLNNLALLLQATNRLAEAEPLYRRALEISENSFGKEHPMVATYLCNLGALLQVTNRFTEAEPLMKRALAIDEKSYGPNHPNVAIRLNNLALLLRATNHLAEAEPLYRRALEISENSFGKEHPMVATYLCNLGALLQVTNRFTEAEPLMRRALDIDERSFGKTHSNVAIRLNNLARLLQDTNHLTEAEPLMRRAFEIFVQCLGVDHPSSKKVAENYRFLLEGMGLGEQQIHKKLEGLFGPSD